MKAAVTSLADKLFHGKAGDLSSARKLFQRRLPQKKSKMRHYIIETVAYAVTLIYPVSVYAVDEYGLAQGFGRQPSNATGFPHSIGYHEVQDAVGMMDRAIAEIVDHTRKDKQGSVVAVATRPGRQSALFERERHIGGGGLIDILSKDNTTYVGKGSPARECTRLLGSSKFVLSDAAYLRAALPEQADGDPSGSDEP